MPALPKLPSLGDSEGNKGGVLVPLDNGTLRGSAAPLDMSAIPPDEETPAGKDTPETAAPAADPAVSAEKPAPAPMGEIAPADTFTEKPKQPVACLLYTSSSARVFLICLTDYGKVRHRYGCLGGHAGWKRRHGAERRYAFSRKKKTPAGFR